MKKIFLLLAVGLFACALHAANPVPYTEGVSFSSKLSGAVSNTVTVTGETTVAITDSVSSGTHESDMGTVPLRPGKQYDVTFTGRGTGQYWLSVIAPQGYATYIDNVQTDLVTHPGLSGSYTYSHTLEIRPIASVAGAGEGTFSGIEVGKSVTWEVSLGNLRTGRSAGKILFKELDLTNSPVSRDRLYYAAPPANVGQLSVIYDGPSNQTLRQVCTPVGFVDIVDDVGGGYWFKFYFWGQTTWNGTLYTFTGSPWKTIRVESPSANQLKITETEGSNVRISILALSSGTVTSGAYVWTQQVGDGTTWLRTVTHTSTVPSTGIREDVAEVHTGNSTASGTLAAKTKYHFETMAWGEEMTQVTTDPDASNPSERTTTYTYYTTAPTSGSDAQRGNYRKVQSMTNQTGNWVVSDYYDDWDRRGQLKNEYRPYLDSPAAATSFSATTGHVVSWDYVADWTGRFRSPSSRQESINNVVTGKTVWTIDNTINAGSPRDKNDVSYYRDATNSHSERQESIRADADPDEAGHPYLLKEADQSQVSWSVSRGNIDDSTKTFTVDPSGGCWREIKFNGSSDSSGADAQNSYQGQGCEWVWMIPNQSTMEVTMRLSQGVVYRTEKYIYTGSNVFQLSSYEDFSYDGQGRMTQRTANNSATTTCTYTDGHLTKTVGPDGTETQLTYDVIGRVLTQVKKGAAAYGTYAAQGDIITTYTYDGANNVTQTQMSGGALTLISSASYDLSGRPIQAVAPGGYTTSYTYSSGGRIVTTTLPGGTATKITETYLDTQPKSTTGTSVVAQYASYSVDGSTGNITQQTNMGTSTSTNVTKSTTDWLGRALTQTKPGWNGSDVTRSWFYNNSGQLYKFSQPGMADTLYQYDTLGTMTREGLDIDGNGSLDLAGSDRIVDHAWTFFSNSGWWLRTSTSTYATTGSSTATLTSKTEHKFSGFPANRLSRDATYDIYGNDTADQTTDVDPANKTVTTTLTAGDSTTDGVKVYYNGLLMSTSDTAGVTTTYGYDALGRPTTSTDARTGTSTIAYASGSGQISTMTDPAGITQATYSYDTAGRVSTVTDALSKVTRYAYTDRNEKYRVWGDTSYPIEYGFDSWGRQTTMKTYRGGTGWTGSTWPASPGTADTTSWAYHEPTGLLSSKTDASSHAVSFTYTQAGQIATRTLARGVVTTYAYSSTTGEATGVTYSDSTPSSSFTYNRLGQTNTVSDATGTSTFTYNLAGTLELQYLALDSFYASRRFFYGYDTTTPGALGRPTLLALGNTSNFAADQFQNYVYQADGRLSATGAYATGYSALGFYYTYTANSHLIETVSQGDTGYTDTQLYDLYHDEVASRTTIVGATTKAAFVYTRDNLGRITQTAKTGEIFKLYGNGTQGLTTYNGYNDRSELTSDVTKVGTTATVLTGRNDAYSYDNIGNRTSTTHNGNSASYTSNALNQYTSRDVPGYFDVAGAAPGSTVTVSKSGGPTDMAARHGNYFFDAYPLANTSSPVSATLTVADNSTPTPYTGLLSAFIAKTAEAFTYDNDGNQLSDGRWNYSYDAENQLISAETTAAAVTAGVTRQKLTFAYDYVGRRVSKVVQSGWSGTAYATTSLSRRFIYDGWNLVAELDHLNSDVVVSSHFWGLDASGTTRGAGGVGGLLMTQEGGETYLPVYDAMGNVHGMIKGSDGSIAAAYEYDAFGKTLRESGAFAAANSFRLSTRYNDIETGLIYYGMRYYNPGMGRFINRDPKEESGGVNLYGFCANNAVNGYDYLGMDFTDHAELQFDADHNVIGMIYVTQDQNASDYELQSEIAAGNYAVSIYMAQLSAWVEAGWDPPPPPKTEVATATKKADSTTSGGDASSSGSTSTDPHSATGGSSGSLALDPTAVGLAPFKVNGNDSPLPISAQLPYSQSFNGFSSNNSPTASSGQVAQIEILLLEDAVNPIPPELLETAKTLKGQGNRVEMPDGRNIDLSGKGHVDPATDEKIETPHVHDLKPANPAPYDQFPAGHQSVPRPATAQDIIDAILHLFNSGGQPSAPAPIPMQPKTTPPPSTPVPPMPSTGPRPSATQNIWAEINDLQNNLG